eukprot:jgi/Mesen1/7685/ME000403S06862
MASEGGQTKVTLEDLPKLPPEQLKQVKEQLESELNVLNDSLTNIHTAINRLDVAGRVVKQLEQHPEGKRVLIPLTASLYVPGELSNTKSVLLDVGTGYFIEKTIPSCVDYCKRKIDYLKGNQEKVIELASQKGQALEQVSMFLQQRPAAAR